MTTDREPDPYRNLITAIERDVIFVAINGEPFYGTRELMHNAGAQNAEPIEVGTLRRQIVLVYPGIKDADMGWNDAVEAIRLARRDPHAARAQSEAEAESKTPLELVPDKPWDQHKQVPLSEATKGQADSLTHDTRYFDAIDDGTIHDGQLSGLRAYYQRR